MTISKKNRYILLLIILVAIVTSYISTTDGGDFDCYLQAARQLAERNNIYKPPFVKDLQYFYSVFFALILSPFGRFIFITEFVWLLLSYFFLFRILKLTKKYFDLSLLTLNEQRNWLIISFIVSLQFIMYEVSLIQVTIFILWGILESIWLIQNNKQFYGGALLGLVINIKIMPILLLPYLFYRGYFKAFFTSILIVILLLYIPSIFIGIEYNNFLLAEWWKVINPNNKEHMFETGIGTHSLVALIPVYLTPTLGDMPYKRNIFSLNPKTVELIVNLVRLLFLAVSLFFLRSLPFKKENNVLKTFWEMSYFILLIPLLLPHQNKYDFLLALPLIFYIIYYFLVNKIKSAKDKFMLILFILSLIIYSPIYGSDLIGNFLFRYTQHYRILTISTILIIPIGLYCKPTKLIRKPLTQ